MRLRLVYISKFRGDNRTILCLALYVFFLCRLFHTIQDEKFTLITSIFIRQLHILCTCEHAAAAAAEYHRTTSVSNNHIASRDFFFLQKHLLNMPTILKCLHLYTFLPIYMCISNVGVVCNMRAMYILPSVMFVFNFLTF